MERTETLTTEQGTLTVEVSVESDGLTSTQTQTISVPEGADVTVRITDEE